MASESRGFAGLERAFFLVVQAAFFGVGLLYAWRHSNAELLTLVLIAVFLWGVVHTTVFSKLTLELTDRFRFNMQRDAEHATDTFELQAAAIAGELVANPEDIVELDADGTTDDGAEAKKTAMRRKILRLRQEYDKLDRQESITEIITAAAQWGWNLRDIGFKSPPVPVLRWNGKTPSIAYATSEEDHPAVQQLRNRKRELVEELDALHWSKLPPGPEREASQEMLK